MEQSARIRADEGVVIDDKTRNKVVDLMNWISETMCDVIPGKETCKKTIALEAGSQCFRIDVHIINPSIKTEFDKGNI
jgi:hypothetical protein